MPFFRAHLPTRIHAAQKGAPNDEIGGYTLSDENVNGRVSMYKKYGWLQSRLWLRGDTDRCHFWRENTSKLLERLPRYQLWYYSYAVSIEQAKPSNEHDICGGRIQTVWGMIYCPVAATPLV